MTDPTLSRIDAQIADENAELARDRRGLWPLVAVAIVAGLATGLVGSIFRLALDSATALRGGLVDTAEGLGGWGWVVPVLVVAACAALARALVRLAPEAAGSGVQHVEAAMRGEDEPARLRVLPVKFLGGLLALGGGLALGREGPTVQMGASLGAAFARLARLTPADVRDLSAASAGAGLGVAFGAPFGGMLFTFEEVRRAFTTRLAVAALVASSAAGGVLLVLLGRPPDFALATTPPVLGLDSVLPVLAFGALLGLAGVGYNRLVVALLDATEFLHRIAPEVRAAAVGAVVGLLLWFDPLWVGGGDELNRQVLAGAVPSATLLVVLLVRWFLGPLSYAAGTPGGLFAPLLLVGSAAGVLFAQGCNALAGTALDPVAFALIGMATLFTGVVRAPLTGAMLIVEMTATTTQVLPTLAACGMAMAVATVLRGQPVYDTLRLRMLRAQALAASDAPRPKP